METRVKLFAVLIGAMWLAGCSTNSAAPVAYFDVPSRDPVIIEPVGTLPRTIDESSGLTPAAVPGVFWTHNDSGDSARIFAIDEHGALVGKAGKDGVKIEGAKNVDWEEIATDFNGNLLIGAFGNNANKRRDLAIYQVPEPDPGSALSSVVSARWPFHYPEQYEFPPILNNYDCEALFVAAGQIYLLTKHRSDRLTTLYRLDSRHEDQSNALTILGRANLRGAVTAAASWNNGERVAVLTYAGIWLFSPPERDGSRLFHSEIRWLPTRGLGQCEAIGFLDATSLMITNEQREVFHVPVSSLETAHLRYPATLMGGQQGLE